MIELLESIKETTMNVQTLVIVFAIVYVPLGLYILLNGLAGMLADKVYAKLEERKKQKEYDEMITRHEERYHNK